MSDSNELDIDDNEAPDIESSSKKPSGLAAMLPNLLKFVAIGLGALIFIVTVSVITFNILNNRGTPQSTIPENSPFVSQRPEYSWYSSVGRVQTNTSDPITHTVVVDMVLGYDFNDSQAATELAARLPEIQDFVRSFFRAKRAAELQPANENRIKLELMEILNTRYLNRARIRAISFRQFDVMETP